MWVHPQLELPLDEPAAVSAVLTILASPTGATSVHWKLFSTVSEELIAMGATLRPSYQDAAGIANEVLAEVLRILPTLADPDPF